jgi:hypothetical protein
MTVVRLSMARAGAMVPSEVNVAQEEPSPSLTRSEPSTASRSNAPAAHIDAAEVGPGLAAQDGRPECLAQVADAATGPAEARGDARANEHHRTTSSLRG